MNPTFQDETSLEDFLSCPSEADIAFMGALQGDLMILGAGGKMGSSLAWRAKRAAQSAGVSNRIIAVSRFASPAARDWFEQHGIYALPCDLMNEQQLESLPSAENVYYLAGRKFGSSDRPDLTWASNCLLPALVAARFRSSHIVAFSTGNVYPLMPVGSAGSRETDRLDPVGEYAQSCLGRERIFEYFSREHSTPCLLYRLNYASDLRYGVLVDIARKVREGLKVNLSISAFNTIWQGDADSYALRALSLCQAPPQALNVTGTDQISVEEAASYFANRWNCPVQFAGESCGKALLSDASHCYELLGKPAVTSRQLMEWTALWIEQGGRSIGKPTKFEVADGRF
jgi:dTDP-4-dehydrorhamnose reductase